MTPDELWDKYQYDGWVGPTAFKAALAEYGKAVRAQDVEIANRVVGFTVHVHAKDGERDTSGRAAAAIEGTPLP